MYENIERLSRIALQYWHTSTFSSRGLRFSELVESRFPTTSTYIISTATPSRIRTFKFQNISGLACSTESSIHQYASCLQPTCTLCKHCWSCLAAFRLPWVVCCRQPPSAVTAQSVSVTSHNAHKTEQAGFAAHPARGWSRGSAPMAPQPPAPTARPSAPAPSPSAPQTAASLGRATPSAAPAASRQSLESVIPGTRGCSLAMRVGFATWTRRSTVRGPRRVDIRDAASATSISTMGTTAFQSPNSAACSTCIGGREEMDVVSCVEVPPGSSPVGRWRFKYPFVI